MKDSYSEPKNQEGKDEIHGRKMDFLRAVRFDRELTDAEKNLAGVLIDHYNAKEGMARPGKNLIALAAGIHMKTVGRALRSLEDGGWFRVTKRHEGRKQLANAYIPALDRGISLPDLMALLKDQRTSDDPLEVAAPVTAKHAFRGAPHPETPVPPSPANDDAEIGDIERRIRAKLDTLKTIEEISDFMLDKPVQAAISRMDDTTRNRVKQYAVARMKAHGWRPEMMKVKAG